jgi:hypothetical protein
MRNRARPELSSPIARLTLKLAPTVLLFADENGEDGPIDIARVAIYGRSLTPAEAAGLGGVNPGPTVAGFVTPPFLQNVKPDGITLMWEMDVSAAATVAYGADSDHGQEATATGASSGTGTVIFACHGSPCGQERLGQQLGRALDHPPIARHSQHRAR